MADQFADAKVIHTLPWNSEVISAVAFIGNDKVAAGNKHGDILIYNLPSESSDKLDPVRRLVGHTGAINRLLVTPDGNTLISASNDRTVKYWDAVSDAGEPGKVVLNDGFPLKGVVEKVDKLPTPPEPHEAQVIVQKPIKELTGHKEWIQGLALSQDGKRLVTGDDQGVIIVWDLPAGTELNRWQCKDWVRSLAISPDGKTVAVSQCVPGRSKNVVPPSFHFWDADTGEMKVDLTKETAGPHGMSAVAYSPDGKWLAMCRGSREVEGPTGKVTVHDPTTGKTICEFTPPHTRAANDVAFHPDGKHLFSAGRDQLVKIWQLEDGKLVRDLGTFVDRGFWITSLSISPDGRLLAAADDNGRKVLVYSLDGKP
ncbi:WD40 repeat domain-containing protein [Lignipirellula cremea]|uniref:WD domain, G-beta repeat n=1 Tax=Lignipirellula cremea TaxID=2528010 RepID=A0A518DKB2_9BACT|nr:WD40 repeat domain-containing protein [Lignipirellula cremea]QDU92271.1 WD domain, G-beta repeat [Lignipirellula cremea]